MPHGHVLKSHAFDFWLARGTVALSALLNLFLVNKLTPGPYWIAPLFDFALLVPLSVATAWTQIKVQSATTQEHWDLVHQSRRWIRGAALLLTFIVTAINLEGLVAVMRALLHGAKGATGRRCWSMLRTSGSPTLSSSHSGSGTLIEAAPRCADCRTKVLFMLEAIASLATVGLIAARAVNILV